jgi:hypothetical protein
MAEGGVPPVSIRQYAVQEEVRYGPALCLKLSRQKRSGKFMTAGEHLRPPRQK